MDPSALIFLALAVAWAVYLVPKALKHHDDAVRSRSVDRFSQTMRVLARREPVDRRNARLVVSPGRAAASSTVTTKATSRTTVTETIAQTVTAPETAAPAAPAEPVRAPAAAPTPAQLRARRAAANRAARRRRNVLATILVLNLVVVALAAFSVVSWWTVAVPAGLLVAWLVACRLMVKQERAAASRTVRPRRQRRPQVAEEQYDEAAPEPDTSGITVVPVDDWTADTSSIPAAVVDPTLWDPVPVTLPTYVTKPAAARRTVRTIDLGATGVWTSGRTDADAALAREAEQADQARKAEADKSSSQRAVGS